MSESILEFNLNLPESPDKKVEVFGEQYLVEDRSAENLGSLACVLALNTHKNFDGPNDRDWDKEPPRTTIDEIISLN